MEATNSGATPEWKQYTVLAVDDEPDIREDLSAKLEYAGLTVQTAASGEEALRWLATNAAHVIISDQKMPGMTGNTFLAAVKDAHPETIRIVLSGFADQSMVMDALNEANALQYITKPWNDDDLLAKVTMALQLYHANAERKRLAAANERLIRKQALLENYSWFGQMSYDLFMKLDPFREAVMLRGGENRSGPNNRFLDAASLVSRLCEYSLLAREKFRVNTKGSLVNCVANGVGEAKYWLGDNHGVRFESQLADDVPAVIMDTRTMSIAVNAMIENAILHNDRAERWVKVECAAEEDEIVVRVHDNGRGVRDPSRIFSPVYTEGKVNAVEARALAHLVDVSTKIDEFNFSPYRHVGLGLPFARYCVTQHDGTLSLEHSSSTGSCFRMAIPLGQPDLRARLGLL